jgi:hypothetical protein
MSDLSNGTKKHTSKSRVTNPLILPEEKINGVAKRIALGAQSALGLDLNMWLGRALYCTVYEYLDLRYLKIALGQNQVFTNFA